MKRPELLIPAGDLETLKIAVTYGADAVYVGGELFSLRAKAKNFTIEDLMEGVAFAHEKGVRVYIALNIYAFAEEIEVAEDYFKELAKVKPDALIMSEFALMELAKKYLPEAEIHISTQWSNCSTETFKFWYKYGAKQVVTARELSIAEIKEIRKNIPEDMRIESFIHGAMCISYSGKCQLSTCLTGRDSNHGECTHPCRWKFALYEGEGEDRKQVSKDYAYFMNSKDLCMLDHIPDLVDAGIESFKIEGRMKTVLYVATVARTYRMAIDDYFTDPALYEKNLPHYMEEISKGTYRAFTTGFYYGTPDHDAQIYDNNTYVKNYTYLGYIEQVTKDGLCKFTQRNKFSVGEEIEIMKPDGTNVITKVLKLYDEKGIPMESCPHPKQPLFVELGVPVSVYDVMRRKDEM